MIRKTTIMLMMTITMKTVVPVVKVVESAKENVRIMKGADFRKLDGVSETARKGLETLKPAYVKAVVVMMINKHPKYAEVGLIVSHVRMSAQKMRVAEGNQRKNVRPTVKRSGEVVNALVVQIVDRARESVRIMRAVASRKLDGANVTVKKGSETL